MDYVVTKVSMESSGQGGNHEHIESLCTQAGAHYTRTEVI